MRDRAHPTQGTAAERASAFFVIPSLAVLALVGLHWAQPPTVVAQIDLPPPFSPLNSIAKCAFSWGDVHTYFGSIDNCGSWFTYDLALAGLDSIVGPSFGQAIVFIIPVILSWLGAFAAARALGARPAAAFFAGWLYAFNPARQQMFGEFATGEICAAVLPWIVYWMAVGVREPRRRPGARLALVIIASVVFVELAITPQLLFALVVGALAILALLIWRLGGDRRSATAWAASTAAWAMAASLWWVLPNAVSYAGVAIAHPVDPHALAWTFARASIWNELRFCATWVWRYAEYNPYAVEFERDPWLVASGFFPAAACGFALFACRGSRAPMVRALAALGLAMLFIAKGTHPPLEQITLALYAIPGMFLFIEPYGAVLWAALAFALCGALGAEALFSAPAPWSRRAMSIGIALAVLGLFANNVAALTGAIFHERMMVTPNEHIRLSPAWSAAAAYLDRAPGDGGVLVLPPDDHYQGNYTWGYHGVDVLAAELVNRDVLMSGAPYWYTQAPPVVALDSAINRIVAARSRFAPALLRDLGIRYVLVRDDVMPASDGLAPSGDRYRTMLVGIPFVRFGALTIFDLGPPQPLIARVDGARRFGDDPRDAGDAETFRAAGAVDRDSIPAKTRIAIGRLLHPQTMTRVERLSPDAKTAFAGGALFAPTLVGRDPIDGDSAQIDVENAAPGPVRADVRVGVWPRRPSTFTLAESDGSAHADTVSITDTTTWARFSDVLLEPGTNRFAFQGPSDLIDRMSAFLPPRSLSPQQARPNVYDVEFGDIRLVTRTEPSGAHRDYSLRIDRALADDPAIEIAGAASGTWWAEFSGSAGALSCAAPLQPGASLHLRVTARDCLAGLGITLTEAAARHTRVMNVGFESDSTTYPPPVTVTWTPLPPPDATAASARDAAPDVHDVGVAWSAPGLALLVRTGAAGAAPLVMSQTFSPTWVAFDLDRVRVMPHVTAFAWSNAWEVEDGADILIVNWLSAVGLLSILLAAAAIGTLARQRRPQPDKERRAGED